MFGYSLVVLILFALIAICIFVVAAWLIPVLFALVGFPIPARIANILALLIAFGVVYGNRGRLA